MFKKGFGMCLKHWKAFAVVTVLVVLVLYTTEWDGFWDVFFCSFAGVLVGLYIFASECEI